MPRKHKPGAGRPRLPAASRKSVMFTLKCTPSEAAEIRQAAAEAELTIRDFLVSRALRANNLQGGLLTSRPETG